MGVCHVYNNIMSPPIMPTSYSSKIRSMLLYMRMKHCGYSWLKILSREMKLQRSL